MKYALYLAIGDQRYKYEAKYSIQSLLKANSSIKVVIGTDDRNFFEKSFCVENIEYLPVADKIERWKTGEYFFTAKIEVLEVFFELYNSDVIFIDTDTVCINDITHYDTGKSFYLHSQFAQVKEIMACRDESRAFDSSERNITPGQGVGSPVPPVISEWDRRTDPLSRLISVPWDV